MKAYKCTKSGLLFPGDYVEQWGKKYGMGLGPMPVSEVLDSIYSAAPSGPRGKYRCDDDDLMFPWSYCCAPVIAVEVTQAEFDKNKAILRSEDRDLEKRMAILRGKQKTHPEYASIQSLKGQPA